ncbi:MAG TPA: MMPL family transporter [Pirellulales bacterium]|nr:MMPL family transporter [Pirellulales bacterium]
MKRSFYDRNAQTILLVSAFLVIPTFAGAFRALKSNKNDVAQWLPAQYEETTTFKWFRRHFAGEQFILVSWDGCTLDRRDELRLMVAKLDPQHHPTKLDSVAEGEAAEVAGDNPAYFKEAITGKDLLDRLTSDPVNLSDQEALSRLKGTLIGPDGKTTCIVLTLTEQGKEHMRDCVTLVRRIAREECNIPPENLHMGGPPVDNVAIDEAGEQSLYRLAGFAAMIGLVISWWCLRNIKLIAIVFFAGIYGAAASLAIVWYSPLLLGHETGWIKVNAILLTMPSLVYVATISGAIHLSNYYRDLLEEGIDAAIAPEKAILHAWLPLTLATATTSVGLWTLCYSELVPIQLFGLYSGVGVVVSALLLFFHVPAALQVWPLREFARQAAVHHHHHEAEETSSLVRAMNAAWNGIGLFIIRHNGLVSAACLLLLVACGWGMTYTTTSVHLMRLFPPDARILADYTWLEKHLGDLVPMEVILKIDPKQCKLDFLEKMELVERVQQKLEETDEVGGVLSAVTFSPHLPRPDEYRKVRSNVVARMAGLRNPYQTARRVTAKNLEKHRDEYIKGDYLSVEDDGTELWRISARVGALSDVDYGNILAGIREHVAPVLDAQAKEGTTGIEPVYTGLVPLVYKAQRSLLQGLIWGFVSDFVLITIVMMIAVRDLSAGLILALPSIFPAVMVFGVMGWAGIVVDIGTVMAPSVALGVTVDDVVHFMIQYRGGLKAGLSRGESVMLAYKGCARAMYQSWGVIGLGMSVFAFSPFTPTQRFGYMMVTLLTSALIGNLLLLPSLLAGPLGSLFGRRYTRTQRSPSIKPVEKERPAPASVRMHSPEPVHTEHYRRGIKA